MAPSRHSDESATPGSDDLVLPPLALVGMTASGKTAVSIALAKLVRDRFGTAMEAVSADSMQVYRYMDIGTAKPTQSEQQALQHHLIDVVDPDDEFDVASFQRLANKAIEGIQSRGAFPVLVGGTGLYQKSVIDNFDIPPQFPEIRVELERSEDTEALFARLQALDAMSASRMEPTNRRRIIRALEVCEGAGRAFSDFGPGVHHGRPSPFVQVGIRHDRSTIRTRIAQRLDTQFEAGFVEEVVALRDRFGALSRTALQGLGYREIWAYLGRTLSLDECVELTRTRTMQFAVRQERWFRRDSRIVWVDHDESIDDMARSVLESWLAACRSSQSPDE